MADIRNTNIYEQWVRERERIQNKNFAPAETREEQDRRIRRARKDYDFFCRTYIPHLCTCPNAAFHTRTANYLRSTPNARCVSIWPRGHAKSVQMGVAVPLWLKMQEDPKLRFRNMLLVGKSEDNAQRLLADLQEELQFNELYMRDFGPQMKQGNWAQGEFTTSDGCHFAAIGRGQSPRGLKHRGHRPDYILIDDIDDDELVRNPRRVRETADWVLSALFGSMAAGRGRFVMVGNRIAKESVLTAVADRPGVKCSRINIIGKDGRPAWKENYTLHEISEMRSMMGERNFQKEYMNNPLVEGAVFRNDDIRYGRMLPLREYVSVVCYTDPSFKDSATADYKATVMVGKTRDGRYHVLKCRAARASVSDMVAWHYALLGFAAGKAPVLFYMEANFMQDLLLHEFQTAGDACGQHIPIRGDTRKKPDKFARIEALQPLFQRGLVTFSEKEKDDPGMQVLAEQLLMFQRGGKTNDDAPDALEGAIWLLDRRTAAAAAPFRVVFRPSRKY